MTTLNDLTRRSFLTSAASGLGGAALTSMLQESRAAEGPLALRKPHFEPRAKACIFIYMAGGPSHVDLYDPEPILTERHGQKMPDSLLKDVEFAFIKKDKAVLKGAPAKFRKRGRVWHRVLGHVREIGSCADDIALIRTMHGEQFNHHPGQLLLSCGKAELGPTDDRARGSFTAWQ